MSEEYRALHPISFRVGELSAVRKDIEANIEEPADRDTIDFSANLIHLDGPQSVEQEIFLDVGNTSAAYRIRLRASLDFAGEELEQEERDRWRREVLIPAVCHTAFAEIVQLGKRIDVDPLVLPAEIIQDLVENSMKPPQDGAEDSVSG